MIVKYSPYEVLGLDFNATPEEAKRQYKQLIREYSPENEPEKFIAIREAFETWKTNNLADENHHPFYHQPLDWFLEYTESQRIASKPDPEPLATIFETPYNTQAELRNLIRKVRKDW